jgi:hypothetical protein
MYMDNNLNTEKTSNIIEFYAMEYIYLISNRVLKIWITKNYIFVAKVNWVISYPDINYDYKNPKDYVDSEEENKYINIDFNKITPDFFMKINSSNFVISRINVIDKLFNANKKWGMWWYPHNGRIIIRTKNELTNNKAEREFILIGNQYEKPILDAL